VNSAEGMGVRTREFREETNWIETYGVAGASLVSGDGLLVMTRRAKAQKAGSSGDHYGPPNYPRRFCGFSPRGRGGARARGDASGFACCRFCAESDDADSARGGFADGGGAAHGSEEWNGSPANGDAECEKPPPAGHDGEAL